MIKLYIVLIVGVMGLVAYGLDWYLVSKNLGWGVLLEVWPILASIGLLSFLAGGLLLGLLAEFSFQRDSREFEKELEAKNEIFEKSVLDGVEDEKKNLDRRLQEVFTRENEAESALAEAKEIREDVDRQVIEARADIEKNRKSAFNATKTVERLRRKVEKQQHG